MEYWQCFLYLLKRMHKWIEKRGPENVHNPFFSILNIKNLSNVHFLQSVVNLQMKFLFLKKKKKNRSLNQSSSSCHLQVILWLLSFSEATLVSFFISRAKTFRSWLLSRLVTIFEAPKSRGPAEELSKGRCENATVWGNRTRSPKGHVSLFAPYGIVLCP